MTRISRLSDLLLNIAIIVIVLSLFIIGAFVIYNSAVSSDTYESGQEAQTYSRVNSCILSVPPIDRTDREIENCWVSVQRDTGVTVKRYDQR